MTNNKGVWGRGAEANRQVRVKTKTRPISFCKLDVRFVGPDGKNHRFHERLVRVQATNPATTDVPAEPATEPMPETTPEAPSE